jgi:ABC-type Fe3+ transport system permease subunit
MMHSIGEQPLTDDTGNRRRVRLALVVLLVGIGVLLVAVGMTVLRGDASYEELVATSKDAKPKPNDRDRAMAATVTLVYGTVLLLIFMFAAVALVMASRRYRQHLTASRPAPTPTDDLWAQHRAPDEAEEGDIEEAGPEERR